MAVTSAKAFSDFLGRIELTDGQKTTAKDRRASAQATVRSAFPSTSTLPLDVMLPMGSTDRNTAVRPLDDVDALAVFENKDGIFENYRFDSQSFLYRVRDGINAKTQVRQVGARGQAVRLFYKDGIHVDIAPVFACRGGGYALPSGDKSWLTTDPPKQKTWIDARSSALGGNLKPRAKLLKRWNQCHSQRLGSWHLEVMVASVFKTMSNNHRDGLEKFFDWAASYLDVADPDGHGGSLGAALTWRQRADIKTSFETAQGQCRRANEAEAKGDHGESIRIWKIVLGSDFPAYG